MFWHKTVWTYTINPNQRKTNRTLILNHTNSYHSHAIILQTQNYTTSYLLLKTGKQHYTITIEVGNVWTGLYTYGSLCSLPSSCCACSTSLVELDFMTRTETFSSSLDLVRFRPAKNCFIFLKKPFLLGATESGTIQNLSTGYT